MTLFDYLDQRFRTLNLEIQVKYSVVKEAELKAAHRLLQAQRTAFKYLKMPTLLANYVLINAGLKKWPPKESISEKKEEVVTPSTVEEIPAVDKLN